MTVQPTEDTIRAVAAAISRAEIHDDRMTSDPNRIRAWADTSAPHGITDTALACQAVDQHYTAPGANTLRAGDFIAIYRRLRAQHAEAEKGNALHELPAPTTPDPQLGGLPIGDVDGQPIWHAYQHAYNAIAHTCPTCGAQPDDACINELNGRTRKIPCLTRVKAGIDAGDNYCDHCHRVPITDDRDPYQRRSHQ